MKKWYVYLVGFLLLALVIWIYELKVIFIVPLYAGVCVTIRCIGSYIRKEREQEQRYFQVTAYLEQLLCSYRRLGHAGRAMDDCGTIFESDSEMGRAICEARHILLTGEGVQDGAILEAAFAGIEKVYDSRRMRIIHKFICNGERMGGDSSRSVDILLEDLELWRSRTKLYQNKKRFIKVECGIATVLAVMLCYVSRLLTPDELGFCISDSSLYQVSTVIVLLLLLYLILCIYRKLSGEWLDGRGVKDKGQEERLEKMYDIVCGKAPKASALSVHMARKLVGRYVKDEFPYWLLLVTLYLQSESSYQALRYSMGETSGIFYREIEKLTEEIYDSPRDLEPYLNFFAGLKLPEIQTGMKILYSVSTNGYEDSKKQLDFLVAQNNRLMDQSEKYLYTNKMAGMSMLKQLPMVISCVKLLIDLVNLLALTMAGFQGVG